MAPTIATFDFNELSFGATTIQTRSGGRCVQVGYGPTRDQVFFQLGRSPRETLSCAWGAELANKDDPTSGMVVKCELDSEAHDFLERFDRAMVAAATEHSQGWFNRPTPTHTHNSFIKPQAGTRPDGTPRPDVVKLKLKEEGSRATEVFVATWRGEKLSTAVRGSLSDITKGARVLPLVRVQSGVYFVSRTYGCSLEAAKVLVVLNETASCNCAHDFDYGDVVMDDTEDADDDADSQHS